MVVLTISSFRHVTDRGLAELLLTKFMSALTTTVVDKYNGNVLVEAVLDGDMHTGAIRSRGRRDTQLGADEVVGCAVRRFETVGIECSITSDVPVFLCIRQQRHRMGPQNEVPSRV